MTKIDLGKIEIVDPRQVWEKEEKDFTPWLAENAEAISEVIGIPISIEQTEKRVGAYELDILGRVEGTDKIVVIENQLSPSDHNHLGQLITYAAGLGASIVVWITPQVREEHRTAVEWLNNISGENISFFLIRPEVIRIDNSKPAARFQLEAGPSAFVEGIREAVEKEDAPRHIFRRQFWAELFEYLAENGHPWAKGRRTTRDSWITSSVGRSGVGVNVSMAQGSRLRVEIYLNHTLAEQNTEWYEALIRNKSDIETMLQGEQINWEPLEGAKASRVAVYLPYEKEKAENNPEYRKTLFAWVNKNVKSMRDIARKYLID